MTTSDTNIYISGLNKNLTESGLQSMFTQYGSIAQAKILMDKATGISKGVGFVNFENRQAAEQAISAMNGTSPAGADTNLTVRFANVSSKASSNGVYTVSNDKQPVMLPQADEYNLYVSGLPKDITEKAFEDIFVPFGSVIHTKLLTDKDSGQPRGVGFIRYKYRFEAEKAIHDLNGSKPDGYDQSLTVRLANSSQGSVALSTLSTLLNPQALAAAKRFGGGPIHHQAGKVRYSPFATESNNSPGLLHGIAASLASQPNQSASSIPVASGAAAEGGYPLFVFNLPPETDEAVLWQLFGPFGAVQSVKVIRDLKMGNKCKGYAFVTMTNYNEAVSVIQALNGYTLGSRLIQVSFKTDKNKKEK